jgi:hypothetical protein
VARGDLLLSPAGGGIGVRSFAAGARSELPDHHRHHRRYSWLANGTGKDHSAPRISASRAADLCRRSAVRMA